MGIEVKTAEISLSLYALLILAAVMLGFFIYGFYTNETRFMLAAIFFCVVVQGVRRV